MSNAHTARESWLRHAMDLARPDFEDCGTPIPDNVRVSMGNHFTKNVLGVCFSGEVSADGHREIWIRPITVDPIELLATLIHELAHASLPFEVKHTKPFATLASNLLLEGKPTHTFASEEFKARWTPRLEELGPFPGGVFDPSTTKKARPASHIHMECDCCGFKFFATPKMLEKTSGDFQCVDTECEGDLREVMKES